MLSMLWGGTRLLGFDSPSGICLSPSIAEALVLKQSPGAHRFERALLPFSLFLNRVPEHIVSNVLSFLSAAEVTISGREGNMICEDLMVWNVQRMQSQF